MISYEIIGCCRPISYEITVNKTTTPHPDECKQRFIAHVHLFTAIFISILINL